MPNFSSNIKVMQSTMDKISVKVFRDFLELENLQSSKKSSVGFAQKTVQRVNGDLDYILSKSRSDFGMFINGRDDFNSKRTCEYNWLVSSICGLDNLLRSVPYFCTTIALEKVSENGDREIISVLVENVITKETFIAEKNQGSYVNGRRMRISDRTNLDNSVITLDLNINKETLSKTLKNIKNVRINRCNALDLAYIASGKYDGSIMLKSDEYELAAGLLLITEAKGSIKELENNIILASANDKLIEKLADIVNL